MDQILGAGTAKVDAESTSPSGAPFVEAASTAAPRTPGTTVSLRLADLL